MEMFIIGEGSETPLTYLEWTNEEIVAFNEAIIGDGRCLMPAGVNKHFHMISIHRRFQALIKKKVDPSVLWEKLDELYDLPKLDTIVSCPFPNDQCDFSLSETDFNQLIRDRKGQSSDKLFDDESTRDSGSGRETPPTLPIAKRGASVSTSQSSNKRKYSSSFSETGSDSGGGRDRKSSSSSGVSKSKPRRL